MEDSSPSPYPESELVHEQCRRFLLDTYVTESLSDSVNDGPLFPNDPGLQNLNESRTQLLNRVQILKKDLQEWRGKLDTQVKSYREELGDLRSSLNSEVEQLRIEFQDLRNTLKQQLEVTSCKLAELDETTPPLTPTSDRAASTLSLGIE